MSDVFLCKTNAIPKDGSKGFSLPQNKTDVEINKTDQQDIFIINRDGKYYAYKNTCPHTGASLNWQPDVFLDFDNFYIQCAIHAARFEVETGFCVWGPCANQSLQKIKLRISNDDIFLCT